MWGPLLCPPDDAVLHGVAAVSYSYGKIKAFEASAGHTHRRTPSNDCKCDNDVHEQLASCSSKSLVVEKKKEKKMSLEQAKYVACIFSLCRDGIRTIIDSIFTGS